MKLEFWNFSISSQVICLKPVFGGHFDDIGSGFHTQIDRTKYHIEFTSLKPTRSKLKLS